MCEWLRQAQRLFFKLIQTKRESHKEKSGKKIIRDAGSERNGSHPSQERLIIISAIEIEHLFADFRL